MDGMKANTLPPDQRRRRPVAEPRCGAERDVHAASLQGEGTCRFNWRATGPRCRSLLSKILLTRFILACVFILGNTSSYVPHSAAAADWQFWANADVGGEITDTLSLSLDQSFRWKRDMSRFETYSITGKATHRTAKHLNLAIGYRYVRDRPKDVWLEESRPFIDAVIKWPWLGIAWSDRNRWEWRDRDAGPDVVRYRNRLTILKRSAMTRLNLRPYFSGEWFWQEGSANPEGADRFRFTMGVRGDPEDSIRHFDVDKLGTFRQMKSDLYLRYEINPSSAGPDVYVLGVKVGVFL